MKSFLKMFGVACLLGATLIFSGCGGGGSSSSSGTVTPPPGTETTVALDGKGTADVPVTLSAADDAFIFTDSAATANNVIITGFGADDKITITGATAVNYAGAFSSTAAGDVIIKYNNGIATSEIKLVGAIPAPVGSKFVSSVDEFNALAVGNIEFK